MEATEILMAEHVVIDRVLAASDTAVPQLQSGKIIRPEFFIEWNMKKLARGCTRNTCNWQTS